MMKTLATKAMLAAGAATVAISAVSAPAEAFQVFPDRTDWENAVNGLTNPAANPIITETFDSLSPQGAIPFGPLTTPSGIVISNAGFGQIIDTIFSASPVQTTFGLPSASVAFGVDLRNQANLQTTQSLIWTAFNAAGTAIGTDTFTWTDEPSAAFSFFGIVQDPGDSLISSIQFNAAPDQDPFVVSYNDASFATPVPTPALLPGLIGMGVAALRKRNGDTNEAEA
jgi:hypothetical protein